MSRLFLKKADVNSLLDVRKASCVDSKMASDEINKPGKNTNECKPSPFKPYDEYRYTSDIPMQRPRKKGTNGTKANPCNDRPIKKEITKKKTVDESDVIKSSKLDFVARS